MCYILLDKIIGLPKQFSLIPAKSDPQISISRSSEKNHIGVCDKSSVKVPFKRHLKMN